VTLSSQKDLEQFNCWAVWTKMQAEGIDQIVSGCFQIEFDLTNKFCFPMSIG